MDSIQIINLILDFVFLGLIIFLIVRNCIRGFLDSLVSLVKIVVAPVFAVVFNLPLARFIAKIFFIITLFNVTKIGVFRMIIKI